MTDPCDPSDGDEAWRVLIADAAPEVRAALRLVLRRDQRLRLVGEAANARDLLDCIAATPPDLVLLDWGLPGLHGSGALARLRDARPRVAVVALSVWPERRPH